MPSDDRFADAVKPALGKIFLFIPREFMEACRSESGNGLVPHEKVVENKRGQIYEPIKPFRTIENMKYGRV